MILRRAGQARQEVALTAPDVALEETLPIVEPLQAAVELPAAVCPDGSPLTPLSQEGMEAPQPPGVSPLDVLMLEGQFASPDLTDSEIVTAEIVPADEREGGAS